MKDVGKILGNPDNLDYLFVTHSHYDHLGAVPYMKRKIPGLCIGAHERVGALMSKESVRAIMHHLSDVHRDFFKDLIGDEDVTIGPVETGLCLKESRRDRPWRTYMPCVRGSRPYKGLPRFLPSRDRHIVYGRSGRHSLRHGG